MQVHLNVTARLLPKVDECYLSACLTTINSDDTLV